MTRQQLILIRHAKSADGPVDIERSLAPRGRADAGAIGRFLVDEAITPGLAVVSPARRARQTWEIAQAELPAEVEVVIDDRIYDNDVPSLFAVIADTAAGVEPLVLVGHNPSFEDLARELDDNSGDDRAREDLLAGFKTSGVAIFEVSGPWAEVGPGSATLRKFAAPRGATS